MGGRITALTVQQRNAQRVNVFLDDEFAFGLARITAAWLHLGQELSDEKIAALLAEDAREMAFQRAMRFLEYRSRSEAEVRRNLERHGIQPEVIDEVIQRLQNNHLLDDARFAEAWVENRTTFRPRSRKALALELRRKGLAEEAIQQALEGIDESQEETLAYQAAQKQLRRLAGLEFAQYQARLGGFLGRRGFSYSVIRSVVERTWNQIHSEED